MSYQIRENSVRALQAIRKNPGDINAYTRYVFGASFDGDSIPDSIELADWSPKTNPLVFNNINELYAPIATETRKNYPFIGGDRNA